MPPKFVFALIVYCFSASITSAAEPLSRQIDEKILAKAAGKPASSLTDDAEFLRRVYLDFAGRIPSVEQLRGFLADKLLDKRAKVIDHLLNGPDYPKRMTEIFHVMLMERLGDHAEWTKYLTTSFKDNKPWDKMAREMLRADAADEANRGAAFFLSKRLENYGQNPVDYPALTRDIGRLFLGKNLQCAQCHDHLFIDEYKQQHFQGLFAFVQNLQLGDAKLPSVAEKLTTGKVAFMSVFKKINRETGPSLPGGKEIEPPIFKKGEEYIVAPNLKTKTRGVPKFSTLAILSEQLPASDNKDFTRNIVNRIWFVAMGRGLVHPLDLNHKDNPASHPELLDLLASEFVAHKFDIKWLFRELALTQTYQRSSVLPKGVDTIAPESFLTAIEKRVSAEQLMESMLEAAGERDRYLAVKKADPNVKTESIASLQAKFLKAFANPARDPEEEFNPSLKAALFILNDPTILDWLTPRPGNLIDRLSKIADDGKAAEEMYLSVLSRIPTDEEKSGVVKYLTKNSAKRVAALGQFAWALLASTEFSVNH